MLATADLDDEGADGGSIDPASGQIASLPEMYRWVSSSRVVANGEGETRIGTLNYSIPINALGYFSTGQSGDTDVAVDGAEPFLSTVSPPPPKEKLVCDVPDCSQPRKYRLVKDWKRGACGMGHLKTLEAKISV